VSGRLELTDASPAAVAAMLRFFTNGTFPDGAPMTELLVLCERQGLNLVHHHAQPEPFWSLKLNNYSPKSAYIELNSARVSAPGERYQATAALEACAALVKECLDVDNVFYLLEMAPMLGVSLASLAEKEEDTASKQWPLHVNTEEEVERYTMRNQWSLSGKESLSGADLLNSETLDRHSMRRPSRVHQGSLPELFSACLDLAAGRALLQTSSLTITVPHSVPDVPHCTESPHPPPCSLVCPLAASSCLVRPGLPSAHSSTLQLDRNVMFTRGVPVSVPTRTRRILLFPRRRSARRRRRRRPGGVRPPAVGRPLRHPGARGAGCARRGHRAGSNHALGRG